ncbi:hypothetical protein MRX96_016644 [Rhipicephalus microplus]
MTAGDSKAGDDVSVEVAAAKLATEGASGEQNKEPKWWTGKKHRKGSRTCAATAASPSWPRQLGARQPASRLLSPRDSPSASEDCSSDSSR